MNAINFSVNLFIKRYKINKTGLAPIFLRIWVNDIKTELSTNRQVAPNQWNQKTQQIINNQNAEYENAYLQELKSRIQNAHSQLFIAKQEITGEKIKSLVLGEEIIKNFSLITVTEEHNSHFENLIGTKYSYGSYKNYKTTLAYLKEFIKTHYNRKDIPLKDVNYKFCEKYFYYLTSEKPCKNNGASKHIQRLKKIISYALKMGYIKNNIIANFSVKFTPYNRSKLSIDNIVALQSLKLNNPTLKNVLSVFMFQCYTGLSYADVKKINQTNIITGIDGKSWISMTRTKTKQVKDSTVNHITRINGNRCILVTAAMKDNINISKAKEEYMPVLDEFAKDLPANIKMIKNFDQAEMVSQRLGHLGFDFMLAIGLVIITLLPLGFRASLIVMISIPLSLALGLIALNLLGYSLNQLSIVGLVVALGLLVDDSIVVVENIERWLREGHSKTDAILKGTKQIGVAVVGCTATLVIAFLPLAFLPDVAGEFIRSLPMAVITSVLASMIVALTLVPFIGSRLLKTHTHGEGNFFLKKLQQFLSFSYRGIMPVALKWPKVTISISLVLSVLAFMLFPLAGFKLFPTSEKPMFLINIKLPLQADIPESDRVTKLVEGELKNHKEIVYYTANVGKGNPQIYYNVHQQDVKPDFAQIFVQMDNEAGPKSKTDLIKKLRGKFKDFPFAKIEIKDFEQGTPIEANIVVRVFGDNQDTLRSLSFKVEDILRKHPGTFNINNELNVNKSDVKINIDKEKARTLGVLTSDIDKVIRMAVAGLNVGDYIDDRGDARNVVITLPREKFSNLDVLKNLYVNNIQGTPVQIDQIASIAFETSPTAINHSNKARFAKVTSLTKDNVYANDVLKDIVPKLNELKLPFGYYYKLSGEAESEGDVLGGNFLSIILLSGFLFIGVLLLQFKTFKGIIIVLSIIPLGILGGVILLLVTGNPMSLVSITGFIGLSGIQVKNSLLLVDFTNQLRIDGYSIDEAIKVAGETRFLPVVLTSITAICGLLPIALNPNPLVAPLAIVLIGGLISSTILSRIVTPVMYKLIPPSINND